MSDGGPDDELDLSEIPQSQHPSFLRRLAGPSAHKAGIPIDQDEINRRIAEASKGTKHYENEKRRDADWTERIDDILARRQELLESADIRLVETKVDRIFADMEAKRDLSQTIVHVDMDAFYANVELQYNPDLKDKPFVVCGLGIITTASYEARKFGVRSGQPEFIGKKLCPELILVPVDYKRVHEVSVKIMGVCSQYDPNMHVAGCDEAYLNITKYLQDHDIDVAECVQQLRQKIFESTNLTASAGIAPNMMLAKICSDKNKPNGQFHLPFDRDVIMEFMRELPIRKVPGIGRVGERVLQALGINTFGDIYKERAIIYLMPKRFAVDFLFQAHLGMSTNKVQPSKRDERKSVGASRTFKAVHKKEDIFRKLEYIATLLERDLVTGGWTGKLVKLTYKLDNFKVHTRQAKFQKWVQKKEDLLQIGKQLIMPLLPLRVRLLGLSVGDLRDLTVPADQGIKRYFESTGNSPSKRRRLSDSRASETPGPSRRIKVEEDGTIDNPLFVDEEVVEDVEELLGDRTIGNAEDDADEMSDDDEAVDNGATAKALVTIDHELTKKEHLIPYMGYRGPTTSRMCAVKVGNAKPKAKPKPKKPISTFAQPRLAHALPARSKSEQPSSRQAIEQPLSRQGSERPRSRQGSVNPQNSPRPAFPTHFRSHASDKVKREPSSEPHSEAVLCPICAKELTGDNMAQNEHIDYCLSRGTIMEATAEARAR